MGIPDPACPGAEKTLISPFIRASHYYPGSDCINIGFGFLSSFHAFPAGQQVLFERAQFQAFWDHSQVVALKVGVCDVGSHTHGVAKPRYGSQLFLVVQSAEVRTRYWCSLTWSQYCRLTLPSNPKARSLKQ
jgi:hypothetical protein